MLFSLKLDNVLYLFEGKIYLCDPVFVEFHENVFKIDKERACGLKISGMKKDTHPSDYRMVVFKDFSCDWAFLTKSCAPTQDTIKWEDGNEYPLIKLEISSASHPFFTGKMKFVDTAGRIDKFNKKFAKFSKRKETADNAE